MILYTAISGGKDPLRTDIKCFTEYNLFNKPVLNAKIYKVLPFQFLDTDISVWMDGNEFPLISEERILELLGDNDMALWHHEFRSSVFEEIEAIKYFYPEHWQMVEKYKRRLLKLGFEDKYGLGHCGIIIRRHNDKVKEFCNMWWSEITAHCTRDQISFPYVMSQIKDIKIKLINEVPEKECFTLIPHYKNENTRQEGSNKTN